MVKSIILASLVLIVILLMLSLIVIPMYKAFRKKQKGTSDILEEFERDI